MPESLCVKQKFLQSNFSARWEDTHCLQQLIWEEEVSAHRAAGDAGSWRKRPSVSPSCQILPWTHTPSPHLKASHSSFTPPRSVRHFRLVAVIHSAACRGRQRGFTLLMLQWNVELCVCVFQYLHENGVVHRDLKPENLLYADLSLDAPLKIGNKATACRLSSWRHLRSDDDRKETLLNLSLRSGQFSFKVPVKQKLE